MKMANRNIEEIQERNRGRKVSAIIHLLFLGLLAFPFLQMSVPEKNSEVVLVMDFSSGSSMVGAKAVTKSTMTPKSVDRPKPVKSRPVITTKEREPIEVEEVPEAVAEEVSQPAEIEENAENKAANETTEDTTTATSGSGESGAGDAKEGSSANGNGKGFIEGDGVLSRAVVKYGNTKELAQVNGKLVLKICINRRGIVTFAEWDKEQSTIKDSSIARGALDNVLEYRFEKDKNAPSKECGRLTYIFNVE